MRDRSARPSSCGDANRRGGEYLPVASDDFGVYVAFRADLGGKRPANKRNISKCGAGLRPEILETASAQALVDTRESTRDLRRWVGSSQSRAAGQHVRPALRKRRIFREFRGDSRAQAREGG